MTMLPDVYQSGSEFFVQNSVKAPSKSKGKIYTGRVLTKKKIDDENLKLLEIQKLIDEKNDIIMRQKVEINRLKALELNFYDNNNNNINNNSNLRNYSNSNI